MASNNSSNGGIRVGLFGLLFLLFLGLKLGEVGVVASWSWWWVTAPLWGPIAAIAVFVIIAVLVMLLMMLFGWRPKKC